MSDYEPVYNKECEVVRDEANDFPMDSPLRGPGVEIMKVDHTVITSEGAETYLPEGKLKRIHINQHVIRANSKRGDRENQDGKTWERKPPITIKTSDANHKGWSVDIHGVSSVRYRPDKPLNCGAKVWLETTSAVTLSLTPE